MTEIVKELLEDVQCGDFVQIRYGTSTDQTIVEGFVEKWTSNFLYLRKQCKNIAKIRLDDLRSLEQKNSTSPLLVEENKSLHFPSDINKEQTTPQENAVEFTGPFRVLRQMVALSPGQTYKFDAGCEIDSIKKLVKSSSNLVIKKVVGGVIDSLWSAIKNKVVGDKYRELSGKICELVRSCETAIDFDICYSVLGVLAVVAEDYEFALEPLTRAHKYTLAAYAATTGKMNKWAQIYSLCALFNGEYQGIDQYISETCVARKDVEALKMLLARHKDDLAACEKIAACAYFMFTKSNAKLSCDITPFDSAYKAASQLLSAIPDSWKCHRSAVSYWEEFQSYAYPEGELTGHISSFNPEQKYGFIAPNHFFHITQVFDDSENGILLRRLLAAGLWKQLEVSFELGESITRPGNSAANAIELTEAGYQEALTRLEMPSQIIKKRKGYIDSFNPYSQKGWIISENVKYGFRINNIADPWLKAYCSQCFSFKTQNVTFDIEGKNAVNICWDNPLSTDYDAYASTVSEAEIYAWNSFKSTRTAEGQMKNIPDEDPYYRFPYVDLPIWNTGTSSHNYAALTWGGKAPLDADEQPNKENDKSDKSVEKAVVMQSNYVMKPLSANEARQLADKASNARTSGNLNQAARLFESAIRMGAVEEKILNEYIIVLQQLDRIDEALRFLNEHEQHISESKLVNLRIGLYDKKKDYVSVCPLYERAFQLAPTVSAKSHNLGRLIAAYAKIEDYENALKTCRRWEVFYSQNRYSTDSDKLKKASTYISRQKAYCLYLVGRVEEAREIATALVRINPADTIANGILDGTLTNDKVTPNADTGTSVSEVNSESFSNIETIDDFWDEEIETITENGQSQFSGFVRLKIQQADIAANLKTKHIRDGRYVGSVEEGLKDVESLISRQKVSAKTKSDIFFSACKLLEQIEQIDETKSKNTYSKYRLAGRAMAAWGDVMVSQARQLDTTRMAYLESLRVLTPRRNGMEQGWVDSYNRYIKSFFLAQNGINSLEEYINVQTNRRNRDAANTDIFVDGRVPEVLLPEFTVGMLLLVDAISNQPNRQITFMEDLYSKNAELRSLVCRQLACLTDTAIPDNLSKAVFCDYMRSAAVILKEKTTKLNQILTEMSNVLMRARVPMDMIEGLYPEYWRNYLTATDFSRLRNLYYDIVERSQDFYDGSDFENRAACLCAVLLAVNDLLQSIQNEPTEVSYGIFLPALNQISLKVAEKQAELYQMFLPRITIEETIAPFRAPDGSIQIQLTVKNGQNYQTADSFQLTKIYGTEVQKSELPTTLISLRGGEDAEIGLSVFIAQSADISGSFTATISYCYKCSDAPQNIITKSQDVEFTFIIRSENFKPLTNPFVAYEEKLMESEKMFLGRSTQIDQILSMIHTPSGDLNYGRAIGMYGQTRSGKSSLLYHLTNRLKREFEDELLIWDLGNLAKIPKSSKFMYNFMNRLLRLSRDSISGSKLLCTEVEEKSLDAKYQDFRSNSDLAPSIFCEYMDILTEILKREKKLVVLIADEFTYLHGYINEGSVPTEFMKFWKALLQDYGIFAIIAGQDDMPEFVKEYPNDFGSMELMKLNYLPEADAKRLIKEPLESHNNRDRLFKDDGCIDEIYRLTAGSAYLTIILGSKLVDYLNQKGAYMITKGIVQDFLRTRALGPKGFLLAKHFEPQIDERGHVEEKHDINFELLLCVARLSQANVYASLDEITYADLTQQEIQNHLERLVDRNVLAKEGRDGYWILVKLLEKWLIDTKGA